MAKTPRMARSTRPKRSGAPPRQTTRRGEAPGSVVGLLTKTAAAAVSGARDVGTEVGSVAVTAVRGSVRAAGEIGGDVGRIASGAVEGVIDAADRIAVAAGRAIGNLVRGTVEGVREIMQGSSPPRPVALKSRRQSRPGAASGSGRKAALRKPLARRPSRTMERAKRGSRNTADTA